MAKPSLWKWLSWRLISANAIIFSQFAISHPLRVHFSLMEKFPSAAQPQSLNSSAPEQLFLQKYSKCILRWWNVCLFLPSPDSRQWDSQGVPRAQLLSSSESLLLAVNLGLAQCRRAALSAWPPDDVVNEHRPPLKCLPWDSSNLFAF